MPERFCTDPRRLPVHFVDLKSRALTTSTTAQKARPIVAGLALAAVGSALLNQWLAQKAERRNPPRGRFITVDGVRLHYVERGKGTPLVLLHGNGSMIEDFQSSGLIDLAARKYRVIAIDRPGFGHSSRPRSTVWTPEAQADLIAAALDKIGVQGAIVLGHSWGTLVALALAIKSTQHVQALVLASGYYYPNARADVVILSPPAIPLIGDLLSHTLSPLLSRLMWPLLLRKVFGPSPVPEKFKGFPEEMAVRPSQIRASAAESALMIPSAYTLEKQYRLLHMPVAIVAGAEDRVVESEQSADLHRDLPRSTLRRVPGTGHMVHQTATGEIMSAIDFVAAQTREALVKTSAA
jgi:pimeloyl-ACP methyl ester carboxylesterase